MHDATEGGVLAAVWELCEAAELGAELDLTSIHISQETRELCKFFHIDPLVSLSEGSLVLTSPPNKTSLVLARLKSADIESSVIGRLISKRGVVLGDKGGVMNRIAYPKADPYWKAYWQASRRHWT